ncbi:MAG: DUF3750 domain-containing protein [Beijerinckiaceae bacterium]
MHIFSRVARVVRRFAGVSLALVVLPLGANALYRTHIGGPSAYWAADWSSTGLLPAAAEHTPALVRIYAARTGRWRGIFAKHSWIVLKDRNGNYQRFDKVGWGTPVRVNAYPPDGRWYSNSFETVFAADGAEAERLIPSIRASISRYPFRQYGDYRIWPGPNSNTFTACVIAGTPGLAATLPPTAIGKDYPCNGRWLGLTPSGTGFRLTAAGIFGLSAGWLEGIELNLFGAVLGVDLRRPALKLPGIGRIGMAQSSM